MSLASLDVAYSLSSSTNKRSKSSVDVGTVGGRNVSFALNGVT